MQPGIMELDLHGKNAYQARVAIDAALRRCGGNMSEAAKQLGVTRQSLYRRIEKYKL